MDNAAAHIQELIDVSPIAIAVVNQAGVLVWVNKRFQEVFLYESQEILGQPIETLIPQRYRDRHLALRGDFLRDPEQRPMGKGRELWGLKKSGEEFPVEIGLSPCTIEGSTYVTATVIDISPRVFLEKQLIQAQKLEALGHLASGIAHDINNMLTVIGTITSTQLQFPQGEEQRLTAFVRIRSAVDRGRKAMTSLLRLAQRGKEELGPVNLNEVVQEQISILGHSTFNKITVRVEPSPLAQVLTGDAEALGHALRGLCINSIEAMNDLQGERILTLRTRFLGDRAEIEVEDNGCGMSPDVLSQAAEPFFSTKPLGTGTGLGLALVANVARAHRGTLELKSEEGKGTKVVLRLPYLDSVREKPRTVPGPSPKDRDQPLPVLLVDDDDQVRDTVGELLQRSGFFVTKASRGQDVLGLLQGGLKCAVVILDRNMPGMDGDRTLVQVRQFFPTLPVIMYTGLADEALADLVGRTPFTALVQKPFKTETLVNLIGQMTRDRP